MQPGRIPMSDAEHEAVDGLIAANPDTPISFMRRDPDESGPLVAHIGESIFEIDEGGKVTDAATATVDEQIHG